MDENNLLWPEPPNLVFIERDRVHVWAISLQVSQATLDRLVKVLATQEKRRAESFHFDRDRNRFIAGRGTLRTILGRYLSAHPASVELTTGPNGKPLLADPFAQSGLQFNLAHCEDLALLTVVHGRGVGIDLERIRAVPDAQDLAKWFCSPREFSEFQSLTAIERDQALFRIWTRKEAWLKATGEGLGQWLNKVEVSFQEGQATRFIRLPKETGTRGNKWSLHELTPARGFMGALAMPGEAKQLCCWQWKKKEEFEYA